MKKILPLILLIMMSVEANALRTPKRFINPVFDNVLWTANMNSGHDTLLRPTYAYDLNFSEYNRECEYLDEDEKAVFLKCIDSEYKNIVYYEMFLIRYQSHYTNDVNDTCRVWNCSFDIRDSKIDSHLSPYFTDLSCPDEPVYPIERGIPPEKRVDCVKELRARGWQKYLPLEDKE